MKKNSVLRISGLCALLLAFFSCATGSGAPPPPAGAMSLDEALSAAARAVEARIPEGTEIAVYGINSPDSGIEDFLLGELSGAFSAGGKFVLLARKDALAAVDSEHQFQMSGFVDDKSVVGITSARKWLLPEHSAVTQITAGSIYAPLMY